jgi:hypothetical protein
VIIDPESKLIVSLVVGRRNADTVVQVFTDFYGRTDGYLPELISSEANDGWHSPAERLNQHHYHDNWLHNLLVSASLTGYRR